MYVENEKRKNKQANTAFLVIIRKKENEYIRTYYFTSERKNMPSIVLKKIVSSVKFTAKKNTCVALIEFFKHRHIRTYSKAVLYYSETSQDIFNCSNKRYSMHLLSSFFI